MLLGLKDSERMIRRREGLTLIRHFIMHQIPARMVSINTWVSFSLTYIHPYLK